MRLFAASDSPLRQRSDRSFELKRAGVLFSLIVLTAWQPGCSGPARIAAPAWDPSGNSDTAMQLWDQNQDGILDAEELAQCPGLRSDLPAIDSDRDGAISREELQARLEAFERNQTGLKAAYFRVKLNGKPLPDAEIRLIPEEFLQGIIQPASGKTNGGGVVRPQAETYEIQAMQVGYYRVEVESSLITSEAQESSVASLGTVVEPFSYAERTLAITGE